MPKAIAYDFEVISKQEITPTVFQLGLKPNQPLDFLAGQFISTIIPGAGPGGRNLRRAYSIASGSNRHRGHNHLELCIKIVANGKGSSYLYSLKVGDVFKGAAPYGDFVYATPPEKLAYFIATGTGIAPFRSMLQDGLTQKANLLFGASWQNELLYDSEFKIFAQSLPQFQWIPCVSREKNWPGFKGRVTDFLRSNDSHIPFSHADFYLCGNGGMIAEVKEILLSKGVDKSNIHFEIYYQPSDFSRETKKS